MFKKARQKPERTLVTREELATLPRAGLLRRMAALLYDMFLVVSLWILLAFPLQFLFGDETSQVVDGRVETDPVLGWLLFIMMIVSAATFYIWFWRRSGQTLGMIAWRIRVVGINNENLDVKRGIIRFAAAWPAFWLLGLGYLYMYLDADGDALHEKLSASKTVLMPKHSRPF